MRTVGFVARFRTAGWKRFDEAEFLLASGYTTVSMYLAGYSVECMLKAVLLSRYPLAKQQQTYRSFRGQKAHSFDWLRYQLSRRGVQPPPSIKRELVTVGTWTTDWRYEPKTLPRKWADEFLRAAKTVLDWAERSL